MSSQAMDDFKAEPEVKRPNTQYNVDESLSEWELARQTSKTWSMEQD